jgi:excinuclease UvrABC nuclease subunit
MMNARARAYLKMKDEGPREAIEIILEAINEIRTFLEEIGQEALIEECEEIDLLRKMAEELMRTMPYDPIQDLRERMKAAVAREDYEQAAILRDEIRRIEKHQTV